MKTLCFIFLLLNSVLVQSQTQQQWLALEMLANTAQNEAYLSEEEREVIRLCNLARLDGAAFSDIFLKVPDNVKGYQSAQLKNLDSALRAQISLPALVPMQALHRSALTHARDMARTGKTGYQSSNGQPYYDRIHQFLPASRTFAECYYAGGHKPIEIVVSLLMDTADKEHNTRKNILSSSLQWVGVSIQPHKTYCANTVIDFAQKPIVTAASGGKKSKQQTYAHLNQCPKSTKVIVKRRKFLGLF